MRVAIGLASVLLTLGAFTAPALAVVHAKATSSNGAATVAITGTMTGYTDRGLARMVSPCVATTIPSRTIDTQVNPNWQIRVHFANVYTPRASTMVTAELLYDGHVNAVRRDQVVGLDSAPSAETCQVVSRLTQELWETASTTRVLR
jgi:hypothetical protein